MRGKLDLGTHKLAGVFRAPAARECWKRARMEKRPDEIYRQIWKLTAGAVRDTFASHPEYLTEAGRRAAERSITKRVTGTLYGYAMQVARGRSAGAADAPPDAAANGPNSLSTGNGQADSLCSRLIRWAREFRTRAWGRSSAPSPKFTGPRHD